MTETNTAEPETSEGPALSPRREDLDGYWQSVLDDLEERLDSALRRFERRAKRSRRLKAERDLEEARNNVLRAEIEQLRAELGRRDPP
jgi:hypothetical protein